MKKKVIPLAVAGALAGRAPAEAFDISARASEFVCGYPVSSDKEAWQGRGKRRMPRVK